MKPIALLCMIMIQSDTYLFRLYKIYTKNKYLMFLLTITSLIFFC